MLLPVFLWLQGHTCHTQAPCLAPCALPSASVPASTVLSVLSDISSKTGSSAAVSRQGDWCWHLTGLISGYLLRTSQPISLSGPGTTKCLCPCSPYRVSLAHRGPQQYVEILLLVTANLFLAAHRHRLGILPRVLQCVRLPHHNCFAKSSDPNSPVVEGPCPALVSFFCP